MWLASATEMDYDQGIALPPIVVQLPARPFLRWPRLQCSFLAPQVLSFDKATASGEPAETSVLTYFFIVSSVVDPDIPKTLST